MKKTFIIILSIFSINNTTSTKTQKASIKWDLIKILQTDNTKSLQQFIKKNPHFSWTQLAENLPWPIETSTPLIAAISFKAVNCIKYLLSNNIGNIQSSINTKSSHGFTALQYAQDTKGRYYSPAITQIIKKNSSQISSPKSL